MAEIPVKEIGALLDEVTGKLPKMMEGLFGTLFSAEAGKRMGQAVGAMYRELVDAGMPEQEALKMARDYMNSMQVFMHEAAQNQGKGSGGE